MQFQNLLFFQGPVKSLVSGRTTNCLPLIVPFTLQVSQCHVSFDDFRALVNQKPLVIENWGIYCFNWMQLPSTLIGHPHEKWRIFPLIYKGSEAFKKKLNTCSWLISNGLWIRQDETELCVHDRHGFQHKNSDMFWETSHNKMIFVISKSLNRRF